MFDLHLENDAALAGFALLAQQEAGQDRFADALHQRRGGRQLVIGEVAQARSASRSPICASPSSTCSLFLNSWVAARSASA